jgi:hypothetical protein
VSGLNFWQLLDTRSGESAPGNGPLFSYPLIQAVAVGKAPPGGRDRGRRSFVIRLAGSDPVLSDTKAAWVSFVRTVTAGETETLPTAKAGKSRRIRAIWFGGCVSFGGEIACILGRAGWICKVFLGLLYYGR